MHPSHEGRMHVANRIGKNQILKVLIDGGNIVRLERRRGAELGPHVGRYRSPGWTLANILQVIEHIVQHEMPERPRLGPISWVERELGGLLIETRIETLAAVGQTTL